jgi:hypothetical protein
MNIVDDVHDRWIMKSTTGRSDEDGAEQSRAEQSMVQGAPGAREAIEEAIFQRSGWID